MYYYESEHDMECRGYIDLCDVGSVEVESSGSKAILEVIISIRFVLNFFFGMIDWYRTS